MKRAKLTGLLAASAGLSVVGALAWAGHHEGDAAHGEAKMEMKSAQRAGVVAVLFHADWCNSCKVLDPALTAARDATNSEDVAFLRFDLTDDATKANSMELAEALGLTDVYGAYGPKTGFVLLVDTATNDVLAKISKTHTEAEIAAAVGAAMAGELEALPMPEPAV